MNPDNACPLRVTRLLARSWPELPLWVPSWFVPTESGLRPEGLHPARGVAASGFRPLRKIPTAASRRSLGRVSVPVWLIVLSDQLPVDALVGRYPTN